MDEHEGAVVLVVVVFAGRFLHGEIADEGGAVDGVNGIEVRARSTFVDVFGEELTADFDAHAVGERGEFNGVIGGTDRQQGRGEGGEKQEWRQAAIFHGRG